MSEAGIHRFIMAIVAAQVLTQIGAFTLPALLPAYIAEWSLTDTEAGLLVGAFFAAYVIAVPVLVTLTDRLPTRHVYLVGTGLTALSHLGFALIAEGFWSGLLLRAIAGIGWAGAYMPGLRAITDVVPDKAAQSRAVSWHAAGVGVAGAGSFAVAGAMDAVAGPTGAFLFGAGAATLACLIGLITLPARRVSDAKDAEPTALLDFRPVIRNRAALAWIVGYTVHTWEMAALRAWGVTFLTIALAHADIPWLPGPAVLFSLAGILGIIFSVAGNEAAQRFGRQRLVTAAMLTAALLSLVVGWSGAMTPLLAVALVLAWNAAIYADSSALTAGTVQSAEPQRRGATMGLHSMAGYMGGFIGPLGVGLCLDWAPDNLAWGLAFGHLALITLAGLIILLRVGRA